MKKVEVKKSLILCLVFLWLFPESVFREQLHAFPAPGLWRRGIYTLRQKHAYE